QVARPAATARDGPPKTNPVAPPSGRKADSRQVEATENTVLHSTRSHFSAVRTASHVQSPTSPTRFHTVVMKCHRLSGAYRLFHYTVLATPRRDTMPPHIVTVTTYEIGLPRCSGRARSTIAHEIASESSGCVPAADPPTRLSTSNPATAYQF